MKNNRFENARIIVTVLKNCTFKVLLLKMKEFGRKHEAFSNTYKFPTLLFSSTVIFQSWQFYFISELAVLNDVISGIGTFSKTTKNL